MKIITAPDMSGWEEGSVKCFLAGGISGCDNWQKKVIKVLEAKEQEGIDLSDLVIFNPRQEDFNTDDHDAAFKQIEWEYQRLMISEIFSIYFAGLFSEAQDQVQPIALYELGRYSLMHRMIGHPDDISNHVIISVEPEYKRLEDVVIQTDLSSEGRIPVYTDSTPTAHALRILKAYMGIKHRQEEVAD